MNTRKFFISLIAIASLSCGIKNLYQEKTDSLKDKVEMPDLTVNTDYFGQGPIDAKETNFVPPVVRPPEKPRPPRLSPHNTQGDFAFTDQNDVQIRKKNGMQITEFPSGEIFYLPDEF